MSEGRKAESSDSAVTAVAGGSFAPGLIAGRWEILGLLGSGGMGTVYRARDRELDEVVALKMIRREAADARLAERLRKEVKLSRRVTHKNVARVFELGEHGEDRFFTMELIDGESLRDYMHARGALAPARAVEIAIAICRGLRAAHEVGVIHRDLKPDNVLLGKDGRIALTDFGIAASLLAGGGTDTRSFVGTPMYMSPEQVDGQHPIDPRSDLYALGVVLFEMVTGETPFDGETPVAVAAARLTRPPPDPSSRRDIPRALADVILRAMAREPEQRFRSAGELEDRLTGVLAVQATLHDVGVHSGISPVSLRPISPVEVTRQGTTRLALLPLAFHGPDDKRYLAEGLLDDLIDALSTTPALAVQSRRQVTALLGDAAAADARELGRRLGVDVIGEGSLRALPDARFRLSLRLISATDGLQLWATRSDITESELLNVNESSAEAIAAALTKGAPQAERKLADAVAIDLYLHARATFSLFDPEASATSARLLEQALVRVPDDPTLLSMYALVLSRLHFFRGDMAKEALAAAQRALDAAPGSGESIAAMATVKLQVGEASEASRLAAKAVKLAPGRAPARSVLGRILAEVGPLPDAERHLRAAIELDPGDSASSRELLRVLALSGQYAEAESFLGRSALTHNIPERISSGLMAVRIALWRKDDAARTRALEHIRTDLDDLQQRLPERLPIVSNLLELLRSDGALPPADELAQRMVGRGGGVGRRELFFFQLHAELAMVKGAPDLAVAYAAHAARLGLLDLMWVEHCPLLLPLATSPAWLEQVHGPVAARAMEARSAMKAT